jgi:hypothetical protein
MSNEHVNPLFQKILEAFDRKYEFKCRHCGTMVDMSRELRDCSALARSYAVEVMTEYGTLCDRCYESQESVR